MRNFEKLTRNLKLKTNVFYIFTKLHDSEDFQEELINSWTIAIKIKRLLVKWRVIAA